MKIYTKKGDLGETRLYGGAKISKQSSIIGILGTIDELNSVLGVAAAFTEEKSIVSRLETLQKNLIKLSSDIATPIEESSEVKVHRFDIKAEKKLEKEIDAWTAELPKLKNFILPGGDLCSSHIFYARAICRRAERLCFQVDAQTKINPFVLSFLNRLSDWLFTLARKVNSKGDIIVS